MFIVGHNGYQQSKVIKLEFVQYIRHKEQKII